MACNRDERHDRPVARPPVEVTIGTRRVVMPIDPEGGGTWIAATEAGLAFTLLNGDTRLPPCLGGEPDRLRRGCGGPPKLRAKAEGSCHISRGLVIPSLAHCSTPDAAIAEIRTREWSAFAPFRLLVVSRTRRGEARWDGRRLTTRRGPLLATLMRTSSSLADARAQLARRRLFRRIVLNRARRRQAQDRFHAHVWPSRPEVSVSMSRADARTVSRTVVELRADGVAMRYEPRPR